MGKMLLLSFENSEDDVISEILSILENKQMKICENRNIKKCLEFQGLTINAEKRLVVLCQDLVQVKMRNFSPF